MSYTCSSGNFSSRSCGDHLNYYPYVSCGSSYPQQHLVQSTNFYSPRTCPLGSSLHSGYRQSCFRPIGCQTSHEVHSSCQRPCYSSRVSSLCSPCRTTYAGSQGFGSSSCFSLGYGSRGSFSLSCGSSGLRPQGFSSLGYGSGFCHPSYVPYRTCQSPCYRPSCGTGSGFH
ncbi:keratin-associated protein 13-1-like [Mesocricetus auratus]|uniref:Keratin-associated protein n=1 Tax=Mesocricetus auratus TaxID=10036 RepID=A0A1U7QK28_MESAU|nr:keratin-associated protein 13-1-like [Mesocricetus auratus]